MIEYVTSIDLAKHLGWDRTRASALARAGVVAGSKSNTGRTGRWRLDLDSVNAYLRSQGLQEMAAGSNGGNSRAGDAATADKMSTKEASEILGVGTTYVTRIWRDGKLEGEMGKLGHRRALLLSRKSVEDHLAKHGLGRQNTHRMRKAKVGLMRQRSQQAKTGSEAPQTRGALGRIEGLLMAMDGRLRGVEERLAELTRSLQ